MPAHATPSERFVLDTNIFIEAKQRYYAFDVCPGFWQSLLWLHDNGRVLSVDKVRAEIADFGDVLSDWIQKTMPAACFCSTDTPEILKAYADLVKWVQGQAQFTLAAKAEFAREDNADAWVIAYGLVTNSIVATHETKNPNVKVRVPIPNVCEAFSVSYSGTFDMLRVLETQFMWHPPEPE